MKKTIFLLVFNLLSFSLLAQVMEVGLFGGVSSYMGDMNKHKLFHKVQPTYGATVRYNFNPRVSVRIDGRYNSLSVEEQNPGVFPNRPVTANFNTLSVNAFGEFNFYDYFIGSKRHTLSPYIFAGLGYDYNFLTQTGDLGEFNPSSVVLPFGIGVKIALTSKLGMTIDWTMNRMFNDWLDGFPATYDANTVLQYSDSSTKDYISQAGITLLYKLDLRNKHKCYGVGDGY